MKPQLLVEVFKSPEGIITVTTDYGGGGTRLCGIKLVASGSKKIAEFYLDQPAVDAIVDDFSIAVQESQ